MAKISKSQMAKLFQRLATSYAAGIDLRSAFEREAKTGTPAFQMRAKVIHRQLAEGKSLAESMDAVNYFPDLAISVVKAGEKGGRLEDAFARLGNHYKGLVTFRNNFLQALAWPAFEMVFAILIVGLLMVLCDNMMATMDMAKLDWLWMGSTTGNVTAYFVLVFMFFAACTLAVIGANKGWYGTLLIRLAMRIPLIGKTIEYLALSRFSWTMSVAENAGMNAIDIAELSLRATENFYYKRLEPEVCLSLRQGNRFYDTLKATDTFPDELLMYVENGETAGELAEQMDRLSDDYQARAEMNMKTIGKIGFIATLLFVGLLVGGIVIFAMMQYVNMLTNLSNV